jgi:hypothetical protein
VNRSPMLKPALVGGVLLGILSAVPPLSLLNCACCAWVIGGGVMAANLYVRSSPAVVTLGSGVGLGLLTGAIGGLVTTIFGIPVQILINTIFSGYFAQARQMVSELPNLPPALRDLVLSAGTGGFSMIAVIFAAFFNVIVYAGIAMLGGVLGVAIFEKRKVEIPSPAVPAPLNIQPPAPPPPPEYPEQ